MSRASRFTAFLAAVLALAGCHHATFAVRPVPRIAADSVGKPVGRLQEAFGKPRKIDTTPTKEVYVWFLPQKPDGAPAGFHGCEMEVTVDRPIGARTRLFALEHRLVEVRRGGAQDPHRRALSRRVQMG